MRDARGTLMNQSRRRERNTDGSSSQQCNCEGREQNDRHEHLADDSPVQPALGQPRLHVLPGFESQPCRQCQQDQSDSAFTVHSPSLQELPTSLYSAGVDGSVQSVSIANAGQYIIFYIPNSIRAEDQAMQTFLDTNRWILPEAVGILASIIWTRYFRRTMAPATL